MKKTIIKLMTAITLAATFVLSGTTIYAATGATPYISKERAQEAAFAHAGIKAADAYIEKVELEWDDGVVCYEVDFHTSTADYDYEVNATSGKIISFKSEKEAQRPAQDASTGASKGYITREKALEVALKHAGVKAADVYVEKIDLEWERGLVLYEVDFRKGSYDYDYEIGAKTGKVVSSQKELEDDYYDQNRVNPETVSGATRATSGSGATPSTTTSTGRITAEKAVQAALTHAGVSRANAYDLDVEYENKRSGGYYEVSFDSGRMEYDYKIDAATGKVLYFEKDYD